MTDSVRSKTKIYLISMTAVMTAATCVLAPWSLPVGPVPVTLTTLVIYLSLYLLGWKMGTINLAIYILIGMAGLPVFSGFSGGLGKLAGPTGGYILGYIPLAIIAGAAVERFHSRILHFLFIAAGTAACYALGTVWFCLVMGSGVPEALGVCVLPFIPGDVAKSLVAVIAGPILKTRIRRLPLQ